MTVIGSTTGSAARPVVAPSGIHRATTGRVSYGVPVGILMLDCNIPFVPGDVGNATSYDFPVQYLKVPGATTRAVMEGGPELGDAFVESARYLVGQGVKAITGDCGFMAAYQERVQAVVDVPVFLSSLLQMPLVLRLLHPSRTVAMITANDEAVRPVLFDSAGIDETMRERIVVRGANRKPYFNAVIMEELGELDVERMTAEMAELAIEIVDDDPSVAALFLECSDLPPYAHAMNAATGLPVFDWISFVTWVQNAVNPRPYRGSF